MLSKLFLPKSQKIASITLFAAFAATLVVSFLKFPRGSTLPPLLTLTGKFHPLFLHLPIGLLLGAVVLDLCNGPLRRNESAVTMLLWLGLVSGMQAVLAGYFISVAGGYDPHTLNWHLWTGIAVPVFTFATLLAKLHYQQHQPLMSASIYRAPLFSTAAVIMLAGHFGGTMTHGDILDDVKKALRPAHTASTATAAQAGDTQTVYAAVIAPLLESKCVSCHGAEKQKGELRLDSPAALFTAGDSENPAFVAGKSAASESIVRLLLPVDHDEHMPPSNKSQVTAEELAVLQWWVDAGASPELKMSDAAIPAHIREKMSGLVRSPIVTGAHGEAGAAGPAGAAAPAPDMAPVQALEKELGIAILPLAQNDPALSFNCVNVADQFGDRELAKFVPLADRFADINLGRSKITDAGLASLSGMKNLKKLHLANTMVTDAGVDSLLTLTQLEYLNLFNTKVTDAGLAKLEKLSNLKRLYLWQTGATKAGAEVLHQKRPELVINLGWDQEVKTVIAAAAAVAAAPEAAKPVAAAGPDPDKAVYETLIHPIFAAKCISCHGEEKSKGKLKMHTFAELMKNGDSGEATVVAGKAADSLIIKRAVLPLDEDEHMPPAKKDQLTEKELAILKWWIDGGAKTDVKLKEAGLPDNLK